MENIPLKTSVQYLKGVGPKIANLLLRKGIQTVEDLLFFLPREYEDKRRISKIDELETDDFVYLQGKVVSFIPNRFRRLLIIKVEDDTGVITCKWFRFKEIYFKKFSVGATVSLAGTVKTYGGNKELHHPEIKLQEGNDLVKGIFPVYSEIKGLSQQKIRNILSSAIKHFADNLEEFMSEQLLSKYGLSNISESIRNIHFPSFNANIDELRNFASKWHRRLIFGDFFKLEVLLMQRRQNIKRKKGIKHETRKEYLDKIDAKIPFELTGDQSKVLSELIKDMNSEFVMHRLIQGDVGSGKTILAFYVAVLSILNGMQASMMAPTEILAKQHYHNFIKIFGEEFKVALITGSMTKKQKQAIKENLERGEIKFLIGTHAVIQKDVIFKNLGLVIVDEQHRFGVKERLHLISQGNPDILVLTATPIPRSLAMTIYGDLDISIIKEKPKGRQKVITRITEEKKRQIVYDFIKDKVNTGYQTYFVYPLIEESDVIELKAAKQALEDLSHEFSNYTVALLHGKMRQEEKDLVMREFKEGKTNILLSTTVIEVGIDIPNANIMLIENPERFGLSQLHQLRGRIGRGKDKAYCILILDKFVSRTAYERLKIFESTNDGFKIAEADLEIRGPGEFLGTRQHGLPGFRFANIIRDMDLLTLARKEAVELFKDDPDLNKEEHYKLRKLILESKEAQYIRAV